MANQYTGSTAQALQAITVCEFRFFRSSLRNFMPNYAAGSEIGQIAEYLATPDIWARQGRALGLPSIQIEDEDAYLPFPTNLDDTIASGEAFSVEWMGVPMWQGDPDDPAADMMALMGDSNAANPVAFGWRPDGHIVVTFGVAVRTSTDMVWAYMGAPLHFMLTRASGEDPTFTVRCNGSLVEFANSQAGAGGIADTTGRLFNWTDPAGETHACYGHHFYLRVYNDALTKAEQLWRYEEAKKILGNEKWPIPVYEAQA